MLTIKRSCSYKIITRAVLRDGEPLVAILNPGAEDCELCFDLEQLQHKLESSPAAVVVYNQHDDALSMVDAFAFPANQIYIEIRQDTKGVLGLEARRGGVDSVEKLELIYQ
ncbi:MAG: hypothetical protein ACI9LO_000781 [Planctomycetota bacterium]|jgi:hypothetical protein